MRTHSDDTPDLAAYLDEALTQALEHHNPKLAATVRELIDHGEPITNVIDFARSHGAGSATIALIEGAAHHYRTTGRTAGASRTENP